jgi:alkylation response protein AidB-like acyl-CoA dehydrogenase
MSFARTDEQMMVEDSFGKLLAEHNSFEQRHARLGARQPDRLALWPLMAELGLIGTVLPEAKGGFGGTMRDIAVVMAGFGRTLALEPYLATAVSARILALTPEGDEVIEAVLAGERIVTLASDADFDPFAAPRATARQQNGTWLVSGEYPLVRHADIAQDLILAAHLPGTAESGCFLVETAASGVSVEAFRLIDAASGGRVTLRDAPATLLLSGSAAANALSDALELGITGLAAEAVGIMRALNEATFGYLGTRKQFGVTLASFQALQHRAADMFIAAEEATILTERAIDAMDGPPDAKRSALVSAAKAVIDTAGRKIGHEAVQLHGGMGVSDELNVSHFMRRLAAIRAQLGSADFHRGRFLALAS